MNINIDINTNEGLSELDLAVLRALVGGDAPSQPAPAPRAATPAQPKAQPAKAAQKAETKPEPEEEDEPETSAEAEAAEEAEDAPTLKDAVALATKLVSSGKAADVKKALTDLGAKRVSELKESDVPAFISALS